jgi:hypothetical protein
MGRFIQRHSKIIADAVTSEKAILESIKHEQDTEKLQELVAQLGQVRATKASAKGAPEDEFECALHHKDGQPATFKSTARVVLEVSAQWVYDAGDEKGIMHNFRKQPSYLVICRKCAAKYKVVENLTDTLE